jgi:hypothetical protein
MKVETREYCEKCPFFDHNLGWKEASDPYWETHIAGGCACRNCPDRLDCEANGPKDLRSCLTSELLRRGHPEDEIACYFAL